MLDYFYEISTVRLAIYCAVFFIGLMWLGILFLKPILRLLIGRQPGINDLVFHTTAGFSPFYGLLLGPSDRRGVSKSRGSQAECLR